MKIKTLQKLETWMEEVTGSLCYQPEVPLDHKTQLANALHAFKGELESEHFIRTINKPKSKQRGTD